MSCYCIYWCSLSRLFSLIPSDWQAVLEKEPAKPYFVDLEKFINEQRHARPHAIYPPEECVFSALSHTPFHKVRVVLVGQDPYHGPGQAQGLAFSVPKGFPLPPSLRNIYRELQNDLSLPIPSHGCLVSWADQGVLLLNATLTVQGGQPLSHQGHGWEPFTDEVIHKLMDRQDPLVFLLWGKSAQQKVHVSENTHRHLILRAPHPSPLSAHKGFFGCGHFSKTNAFLQQHGLPAVDWSL